MKDRTLLAHFILLDMSNFDIILGIDWLLAYHSSIYCFHKMVMFAPIDYPSFVLQGIEKSSDLAIISAIKAMKLLKKGCTGYLASLVENDSEKPSLDEIFVTWEYLNVFPNDLPR